MTVDSSFYVPNGKQQFVNGSGVPLANGKVYMYIPSTTTPKNTWQDPNQTTLNANPITLDSNGMALIYGTGDYRQQVYDQNSNLIWDTTVQSIGNSGLLQAANNLSDLTNPTLARQNIGAVGAGGLNQIISLSSGTTLTASQLGSFVELTGTGSFTTVLPTPVTNASSLLTIWNSSTAAQTISSAAGVFTGSFGSNGSTLSMPPNSVVQLIADGTNWNVTFATYMPGLRSWFQVTGNQTISQTGMNLFYQITGSSAYTLTPAPAALQPRRCRTAAAHSSRLLASSLTSFAESSVLTRYTHCPRSLRLRFDFKSQRWQRENSFVVVFFRFALQEDCTGSHGSIGRSSDRDSQFIGCQISTGHLHSRR